MEGAQPPSHKKRSGRRVGATSSRHVILETARAEFSAYSFEGTTMRGIAQAANVDAALIHHFFLSKEGLFIAAVQDVFTVPELVATVVDGSAEGAGERLARAFIMHWENPDIRPRLIALLRSARAFDGATAALQEFVGAQVLQPVASAVGHGKPELRASLVGSQLLGLFYMRYVLRGEPIVSMRPEQLVCYAADTCQEYLTQQL